MSMRTSAMQSISSRADHIIGTDGRRTVQRAATMVTTSMIGVFHQFGFPRADALDNPQRADSTENEARPEHEREIEHASFQNRHNILLSRDAPAHCRCVCKRVRRT